MIRSWPRILTGGWLLVHLLVVPAQAADGDLPPKETSSPRPAEAEPNPEEAEKILELRELLELMELLQDLEVLTRLEAEE